MVILFKKRHYKMMTFSPDLSLNKNPATSEKDNVSENKNLQLENTHETYRSGIKQSLSNSFFDPSSFQCTSELRNSFYFRFFH